ncbi:ketoacyl-ACP synthase III [Hyalangium minutum]|uniref:3-oxoacyl-[acyl-carrier-protein] synthase, KASIII n=1 Tax=Hyalangium minutum TaxID=394096 RepID=A0A085WKQ1_9BACT|nr:ketoacyl-ACP synthase III [Hyalangium minutum]KFE68264.1 3-oxoacyl-[acyl-carrier-protein] synthase, KASIII [Hyalangium minutum]
MSFMRPAEPVYLLGPKAWLPERVVTNQDVLDWMGTRARPSWITHRTGVEQRHWVEDSQACSDIAAAAATRLLEDYRIDRKRITQLLLATVSGDFPTPPSSPLILPKLGLDGVGVLDLSAACAGFTSAVHVAAGLAQASDTDQLVIAADIRSKFLNKEDLATTALFGDGAASCLVSRNREQADFQLIASELAADASMADIIAIRAGGSRLPHHQNTDPAKVFLKMEHGATLFMKGVDNMSTAAARLLRRLELTLADVDWFVPHQANLHLIRTMTDKLGADRAKVVETVQFTGNTSGASVGIALAHLKEKLPLQPGQRILLISAGAGGASACALLRSL